jgi:hypothetical protein
MKLAVVQRFGSFIEKLATAGLGLAKHLMSWARLLAGKWR